MFVQAVLKKRSRVLVFIFIHYVRNHEVVIDFCLWSKSFKGIGFADANTSKVAGKIYIILARFESHV